MGSCLNSSNGQMERQLSTSAVEPELGVNVKNGHFDPNSDQMQNGHIESPKKVQNNTKNINKYLVMQQRTEMKIKKCLLLGAGSSGKTTLFRQLKVIHGDGFDSTEFGESKSVIRTNCIAGILTLLKKSAELYEENKEQHQDTFIDLDTRDDVKENIFFILKYRAETFEEDTKLTDSEIVGLSKSIQFLWNLPEIQATFGKRQYFSIIENMDYFFDQIDVIFSPNYTVSHEDHLRCRIRTTGMIEAKYTINNVQFHLFDVGGQRNERKKWIQLFEGVTAVIFVAALNHYAAVLFEDENKNAMLESLELFEEICNSKWFRATEMILFLNKNDLFRERIRQQIPLSVFFNPDKYKPIQAEDYEEYTGPEYVPNPDDAEADEKSLDDAALESAHFIQRQYEKRNRGPYKRIFVHITTATDQENIQKVFWDVQNIVINSNLRKGGLVA